MYYSADKFVLGRIKIKCVHNNFRKQLKTRPEEPSIHQGTLTPPPNTSHVRVPHGGDPMWVGSREISTGISVLLTLV